MNDCERYNLVMSTPALPKGQLESFFFKVNDPAGGWGLWVKFTILVPADKGAEPTASVWVARTAANDWQRTYVARETLPLAKCLYSPDKCGMAVGESSFSAGATKGRITDFFGNVLEWDFAFDAECRPMQLFPMKWLFKTPSPWFKTFTPYADARASGGFAVNGVRSEFGDLPCMQGHNWGHSHVPAYAWSHCNAFEESPGTVFEGFSARLRVGGKLTRYLSAGVLLHEGRYYNFNGWRHAGTKDVLANRHSWTFTLANKEYLLNGIIIAHRHDFVGLYYPNPDSTHRLCVNSNLANLTLELVHAKDGERVAKFTSTCGGMLELVSPDNWPDVCVYVSDRVQTPAGDSPPGL